MQIDEQLIDLFRAALQSYFQPGGEITSIDPRPMPSTGYSGAQMHRFDVSYSFHDGQTKTMLLVVKDASLVERRTLLHLYHQGHRCIPFCQTLDVKQDIRAPVCMEFIDGLPGEMTPDELERAAEAVAAIHAANLQEPTLMGWLPPADGAFIDSGYVLGTFRRSWAQALEDEAFKQAYAPFSTDLEAAAHQFHADVEDLWQEGKTLTLIHGDLHDGNVLSSLGQPYIVDWEQARCGSLYLDLPNLFPGDDARSYYRALSRHGITLDEAHFCECYRKMGRYVGFKYLGYVLSHWPQRDGPGNWVRGALDNLIDMALHGAKPPDSF